MTRKIALPLLLACATVQAADMQAPARDGNALTSQGGLLVQRTFDKGLKEFGFEAIRAPASASARDTRLAQAIAGAAKKDFIEAGIEESRRALIECQKETSAVLVMPSLRSDSQQAHCYRF
ncbi:hypothetical protein D0T25_12875 [Duganella sp. BJB488]|uniref:hypothetical protein n=1 Tax=unclassified Duganella TaxID=2636909 RepID=UPI000E341845|nr:MULTISPECIES: hypothetical protein [unclassified Duganella]RFP17643.1 hypothetical protein D0T26_15620 [Duganella sp. BJB489]RFP22152.1 hypothetical protein D0T25_12875 [Duganella sp. BJB488]RFP37487.1 hypothetical protein D0T24_05720 [Duganella sp. BJB480]